MDLHRKLWLNGALLLVLAASPVRADYVGGLDPAGDNFLALRTGPGSGYAMILPMGAGTFVTVLRRNGKWLLVELEDGTRGWAHGSYILGGSAPGGHDTPPPPLDSGNEPPPLDPSEGMAGPSDLAPPDAGVPPVDAVDGGVQDSSAVEAADQGAGPTISNWTTYRNDRFGTRIDYPASLFRMLPPPENDDGRTFEARDGKIRFLVFGGHNVFDSSLDELIAEDLAGAGDDTRITQKRRGETWFQHAGYRGGDFFLRKVMLGAEGGVIHTVEISYPRSLKPKLDPMAARMADSLRTGDETADGETQALPEDAAPEDRTGGDGAAPPSTGRPVDAAASTAVEEEGWTPHAFEGFALKAPSDWTASVEGDTLVLKAPDGRRSLMVWWWFPDEPLLGGSDIVSNRKVSVAGEPALWVHSRFEGIETLSVTLDEGRADKKRLHFLFEATGTRLGGGDADFDRILQSVTIGEPRAEVEQTAPVTAEDEAIAVDGVSDGALSGDGAASEEADRRAWAGRASIIVPDGWTVSPDEAIAGGAVLKRPDDGAEIALSFWPKDKPMPSEEVTSLDYTVVMGKPATVLELAEGRMRGRQIFFDEPRGGGARLTLAYRAFGEPLADGLPLFEMVLASLDETLPPPEGTEGPATDPAGEADPFADIDLSDLEVNP
ncbi:MAG: SH3 domain-containing protein [Allorhizobium sp.]